MFIATHAIWPPSSGGAAWLALDPGKPQGMAEETRIHAAPTELGGHYSTGGYKHGAPNGAFRIAAAFCRAKHTGTEILLARARHKTRLRVTGSGLLTVCFWLLAFNLC